jgi:hypothetical protein
VVLVSEALCKRVGVDVEEERAEDSSLRDATCHRPPIGFGVAHLHSCPAIGEEHSDPLDDWQRIQTINKELEQELMIHFVKRSGKINQDCCHVLLVLSRNVALSFFECCEGVGNLVGRAASWAES